MQDQVVNPKEVITKYDQVGCFIQHVGVLIAELDKFADENGNIKIDDFNKALDVFFLIYNHFKQAYSECLGKQFEIVGDSAFAKIAQLLLTVLETLNTNNGGNDINP